jgi:DNA-binding NarL/FixJ family response regulator
MARAHDVEQFEIVVGGETLVVTSVPADVRGVSDECLSGLTDAEREIALDVADGLSNQAIATKRNRAVRTVANQLASIYRKLRIASRSELTVIVLHNCSFK